MNPHQSFQLLFIGLALTLVPSCAEESSTSEPLLEDDDQPSEALADEHPEHDAALTGWFKDHTAASGIDFDHDAGETGAFAYPEVMGPGGALFDMDGDGDLDCYLVQGGPLPGIEAPDRPTNRMFQNDGTGIFTDCTELSGVGDDRYSLGTAVGDIDGDGDRDLLVTNVGRLTLYRNNGDGTFVDATSEAGLDFDLFGMSATFFDADRDGDLDLYITNYTTWTLGCDEQCASPWGQPDYCAPESYDGAADAFFLNDGKGHFTNSSTSSGINSEATRSMGVVAVDFDGDGWQDLYVSNDGQPNLLWINRRDGTFANEAFERGVAVNSMGTSEASMGIAAPDLGQDGDFDLYVTHLYRETHTCYQNSDGLFDDRTRAVGLSRWNRLDTGFGVGFHDFDNDGFLDLAVANGGVALRPEVARVEFPYGEYNRLLAGSDETFHSIEHASDGFLTSAEMSRGLLFGDINGDGRVDMIECNNRGPARVLLNSVSNDHHWIAIRPCPSMTDVEDLGAVVELRFHDTKQYQRIQSDGSYLASSEPVARFGLAEQDGPCSIVVHWSDGSQEQFTDLQSDQLHIVHKGDGEAVHEK